MDMATALAASEAWGAILQAGRYEELQEQIDVHLDWVDAFIKSHAAAGMTSGQVKALEQIITNQKKLVEAVQYSRQRIYQDLQNLRSGNKISQVYGVSG